MAAILSSKSERGTNFSTKLLARSIQAHLVCPSSTPSFETLLGTMIGLYFAAILLRTASVSGSVGCESGKSRRSLPSRSVHVHMPGGRLLVSLIELLPSSSCVVVVP